MLSSDDLMWHLVEEANTVKLKASINKAHTALATAHSKSNIGGLSDGGKGRDRGKEKKSGLCCSNPNCKMKGHTTENCFVKGGGKEHQAPEWWKQKQKAKAKETKKESVNATAKSSFKHENHAYIMVGPTYFIPHHKDTSTALVITSGYNHEAFGVSLLTNLIVDCGASSHFSPDKLKFINFEAISPEPICATDGHTFLAIGCGDIIVTLSTRDGENGPPYYAEMGVLCTSNGVYPCIHHMP